MKHPKNILNGLEDLIKEAMPGWQIPGLAIGVVKDDGVVFAQGFGERKIEAIASVNEDTIFAIGSNTKAFTVAALGLLVQEGKLSWDDPVLNHLPGFQLHDPWATRAIKVRDLLCHRSGLPTWGGDMLSYGSSYTREEILQRVRHIPLTLNFRSDYGYSNLMFLAAGQIVPAVAGMSWDAFIRQRIFQPLGMNRSSVNLKNLVDTDNVALPHEPINGQIRSIPYRSLDNHAPAGAINSTVMDMIQWLRMQINNGKLGNKQFLETAVITETRTPHTLIPIPPEAQKLIPSRHFTAYGLGWRLMDYHGHLVVSHGGGVDGMLSLAGFLPEINLGVVILTNKLPHNLNGALFQHVIDAYLDAPTRDWNKVWHAFCQKMDDQKAAGEKKLEAARVLGTRPSLNLTEYAGTYANPILGLAQIIHENDQLSVHLAAHPAVVGELKHWHYDTFLCHWNDPVLKQSITPFTINSLGEVHAFKLSIRPDWIDPLTYCFERDK